MDNRKRIELDEEGFEPDLIHLHLTREQLQTAVESQTVIIPAQSALDEIADVMEQYGDGVLTPDETLQRLTQELNRYGQSTNYLYHVDRVF